VSAREPPEGQKPLPNPEPQKLTKRIQDRIAATRLRVTPSGWIAPIDAELTK
jgi:hypothetical protein